MKKLNLIVLVLVICIGFGSCSINKYNQRFDRLYNGFKTVEIKTIVEDSLLNVRALEIANYEFIAPVYLTSKGEFGIILPKKAFKHIDSLKNDDFYSHKIQLKSDSTQLNFRALAIREDRGFGITIGNPAIVFSLDADIDKTKIVYQENHPKVFYDSMAFWNDEEGIAIGDPTNNCMSIIITRNGGKTWQKLPCDKLPKAKDGEAAFAASDTNIAIVGNNTWVATGGKASRILYSPDKGKTWQVFNTPIIQGKPTTGIYSLDFYDALNGFAIGGDYTKPNDTLNNKIRTKDGGKTWQVVANGKSPGYRSCVQYIPNSNAKGLVAVGFKGVDYSNDAGNTWQHLSNEGFYTIRFVNDSVAYAAGRGRVSKLVFR